MPTSFYRNYLKEELARRIEKNPRYSLRSFSRSIGFEATVISQIISGKRIPSLKTIDKLISALGLSPDVSRKFVDSLAKEQQSRDLKRKSPYFAQYNVEHYRKPELSIDLFKVIADVHHYGILALSQSKGFKSNVKWIASQLETGESETRLAIDRLLNLGLLEEKNGQWVASEEGFTTADKHITTPALRKHQKQVLEKAIQSLENDPIEERSMSSMTVAIDPSRIPEAKKRIQAFTEDLVRFLEGGEKTRVYEIGVALFPLQKRRN